MEEEFVKLQKFGEIMSLHGKEVVLALVILVAGLIVIRHVIRLLRKVLQRYTTNRPFISTIITGVHVLLVVVIIMAALNEVGVEAIIIRRALFSVTLAAIGLLVIFRPYIPTLPYKVGNFIQVADFLGKVEATTFLHTRLKSFDGKTVFIPNRLILNDTVVNFHFTPERQIRLVVGITYDSDLLKAKYILAEILAEDPRVLDTPAARVFVLNLAESCVELAARPWVKNADYWRTRCDMLEKIKLRFSLEGITIAFPQRDVHLYQKTPVAGAPENTDGLPKPMLGHDQLEDNFDAQMASA